MIHSQPFLNHLSCSFFVSALLSKMFDVGDLPVPGLEKNLGFLEKRFKVFLKVFKGFFKVF